MKKINSENLWKFVNDLATNQKVKFKVFYDDNYVTEILWNGDYFEWEEDTFTSEGFFNPLYDFIVIEEDNDKSENNNGNQNEYRNAGKFIGQTYKEFVEGFIEGWNSIEEKLDEK